MISFLLSLLVSLVGPSAPTVVGPRSSEQQQVVYVFHARERGVPASRLRFRCAVDAPALRACPRRYKPRLTVGAHTLRVRAVDPQGRAGPVSTVRISILEPRMPEVRVGSAPLNAIAAQGLVWTENYGDGTISALDPGNGSVRSVRVDGQPGGIAYGAGSLWVSDLSGGVVTRVDPGGAILARIEVGGQAAGVAASGNLVFVADYGGGLTRIDALTNRVLGRTPLSGNAEAVAAGFGRVWVTNRDGTITTLDPQTGAVEGTPIPVGDDVDDVWIGMDAVWAVALYGKKLARIDPASRQITASMTTPGQASGVLEAAGALWVSNYDRATVSRVDPARLTVVKTYRVGRQPRGLAAAGGSIWVANQGSNSLSRLEP
jgi:streptogramin lyase